MGGWGSGGDNREHDCTNKYRRFDSFNYSYKLSAIVPEIMTFGTEKVRLEGVRNNYGGADRCYFLCPRCGRRSRYLYIYKQHLKCRKCAGLNYRSQQATKNDKLVAHKLIKFIYDKFKVSESLSPQDAMRYYPERPKGMHRETHYRLTIELHKLKMEYHREFMKSAGALFGGLESLNARLEKYRD